MKIAFVGDISLNDDYCSINNIKFIPKIFENIREFIDKNKIDLLIGNLESPLPGDGKQNLLKSPRVHSCPFVIEALAVLRPNILTLANNHIYDCLETGFTNTLDWLKDRSFQYLGAGLTQEEAARSVCLNIDGESISLLAYVSKETGPSLPSNCGIFINFLDPEEVINDIKRECGNKFVIVSLHWGIEFGHYPSPRQISIARSFIDAGAGLVVGHHTHTLQGFEKYKNGYIYYSLGNFSFADIIKNTHVPVVWTKDQRHGGIAVVEIKNGVANTAELVPTFIQNNLSVKIETACLWHKIVEQRSRLLKWPGCFFVLFWSIYQFNELIFKQPLRYFFGKRRNIFVQLQQLRAKHFLYFLQYIKTFFKDIR